LSAFAPEASAQSSRWTDLGLGTPGQFGIPILEATNPRYGQWLTVSLSNARMGAPMALVIGTSRIDLPLLGGLLVPDPQILINGMTHPVLGTHDLRVAVPPSCFQAPVYVQALVLDPFSAAGLAFSNALTTVFRPHVPSDFNGDGISDHAVGNPGENVGALADAGAVIVAYGGNALPTEVLVQGESINGSLQGTPQASDAYGKALASGDFDADGYADLAIGAPGEDLGTETEVGSVFVIYGSAQGLQGGGAGRNDQLFRQGLNGLGGAPETGDGFGTILSSGDFDGDGHDDLAVGIPLEDNNVTDQGVVQILFGSPSGLITAGDLWISDTIDIAINDRFGFALAAGDFDGDGDDELAVGHPYDDINGLGNAGAVTIVHPGTATAPTRLYQSASVGGETIGGVAEAGDYFGFSLTVGDFDRDAYLDLAIGSPYEGVGAESNAGAVNVVFGGSRGLSGVGDQIWTQDSTGIFDAAEANDNFGWSLAAGDFDRDGAWDLAIGVPREVVNGVRIGMVQVIRGLAGSGLSSGGNLHFHQELAGVLGVGDPEDHFGWSLFVGDFDGDCDADLSIGVPGDAVNGAAAAGAVQVLFSAGNGLGTLGNVLLNQGNLPGTVEAGDRFGAALPGSSDR
jgi:hypothetical protein